MCIDVVLRVLPGYLAMPFRCPLSMGVFTY
jgi:hypothetical protein